MVINRMNYKSSLVWGFALILLCCVFVVKSFFLDRNDHTSFTQEIIPKSSVVNKNSVMSLDASHDVTAQKIGSSVVIEEPSGLSQTRTAGGTPADKNTLEKWFESRGRFTSESLTGYESYDIETLKKLVASGDLKAMSVLTRFYLSERYSGADGGVKAMQLSKFAAAYGSIDALQMYSVLYENAKHAFTSQKLAYDDLVEVLAWKNTAALRGDMTWNNVGKTDLDSSGVVLTDLDRERIAQRSQEIYNELLAARKELGLGEFDNSRPVEADRFFTYLDDFMKPKK